MHVLDKDLKYNFKEGKQRVINLLKGFIVDYKADMLTDIKITLEEDAIISDTDVIDQIADIIKTIKTNTNFCEKAIEKVQNSDTVAEILSSMENTPYEEMEETVLSYLFGLDDLRRI